MRHPQVDPSNAELASKSRPSSICFSQRGRAEYERKYCQCDKATVRTLITAGSFNYPPRKPPHSRVFGLPTTLARDLRHYLRKRWRGDGSHTEEVGAHRHATAGPSATNGRNTGRCAKPNGRANLLVSLAPRSDTATWASNMGSRHLPKSSTIPAAQKNGSASTGRLSANILGPEYHSTESVITLGDGPAASLLEACDV